MQHVTLSVKWGQKTVFEYRGILQQQNAAIMKR